MAQLIPLMVARRIFQIRKIGFGPITDIKQITEDGNSIALLARPNSSQTGTFNALPSRSSKAASSAATALTRNSKSGTFAEGIKIGRLITYMHLLNHFIQARNFPPSTIGIASTSV